MAAEKPKPVPLSDVPEDQLNEAHRIVQQKKIPFSWAILYVTGKVLTATEAEARAAMDKISMD